MKYKKSSNLPKIRRSWEINPVTRKVESHKRYQRHSKWGKDWSE